jgi:hypothetical protein
MTGLPWCEACGQRLPRPREVEWQGLRVCDDPPLAFWRGARLMFPPSPTRMALLRLLVEARGRLVPFAVFDSLVGGADPRKCRRVQMHYLRESLAASPAPFVIPPAVRGAEGYWIERA